MNNIVKETVMLNFDMMYKIIELDDSISKSDRTKIMNDMLRCQRTILIISTKHLPSKEKK